MFGKQTFWGLDLGGGALKAVKLRRSKRGLEVVAADIIRLEGEPSAEVSFGRDRRVWRALADLREHNRIRSEPIVAGIPARATFLRPVDFLLVSNKTTDELVRYEVQQHIPFGLDAIVWDYQLFPPADPSSRERHGLLIATKKEVLNNYLLSLSAVHLHVQDIQCAPVALYNFVRYEHELSPTQPFLILDIGATCTDLVAVDGERFFIQTVPTGGNDITRAVAEQFELSFDKADTLKRHVSASQHARMILEAMLPSLRGYVGELQNAVQRFQTAVGRVRFRKAYLFGAASQTVGLERMITDALECEVIAPREFRQLRVAPGADGERLQASLPALAVACGLALHAAGAARSRLSLMAAPAVRLRAASRPRQVAAAILAFFAFLCAMSLFFGHLRLRELRRTTSELKLHLTAPYDAYQKWTRDIEPAKRAAEERLDAYRRLGLVRHYWLAALAEIVRLVPRANADFAPRAAGPRRAATEEKKLWLIRVELREAGEDRLQGALQGGVYARPKEEESLRFARSTVEATLGQSQSLKLLGLPRKLDNNAALDWPKSGTGPYYLFHVDFEVPLRAPPEAGK